MISLRGSSIASLLLRFSILYALLMGLSASLPLFAQLERPLVVAADGVLHLLSAEQEGRGLELREEPTGWSYALRLERSGETKTIARPMHAHGYVLLLLVAMMLATPVPGWRRRFASLAVGSALVFVLMLGLLWSDIATWEQSAFEGDASTANARSLGAVFHALHRTSAAGILPILLWLLFTGAPTEKREQEKA